MAPPSMPQRSKVCGSCKTVGDTIWRAMAKRNMKCHYKVVKTRFPDEAKLLWQDFVMAAMSRPGCLVGPVHFDFMAWIEVKAPGVLQHLAQLATLDDQEQECQPPLIAPLLRRRAPSTGPSLQRCCPSTWRPGCFAGTI